MPSGGELLLVLLVILLLFGSKNLPKMARTLGRTLEEFRRAAREVSDEIMQADDEVRPKPLIDAVKRESSSSSSQQAEIDPDEEASDLGAHEQAHPTEEDAAAAEPGQRKDGKT